MLKIDAIELYVPEDRIDSAYIERIQGWKQGWIEKSIGVRTRHFASPDETLASMAANAVNKLLLKHNQTAGNLDLLIFASSSHDQPIPYNACLLKNHLNWDVHSMPVFDINAGCLSFLNALQVAEALLDAKQYNNIVIAGAEIISSSLQRHDKYSYPVYGDAAYACLVSKSKHKNRAGRASLFSNYSNGAPFTTIRAGGVALRHNHLTNPLDYYYLKQHPRKSWKLNITGLDQFIPELESVFDKKLQEFQKICLHQSSPSALSKIVKRYKMDKTRVYSSLEEYGNCLSASIPLAITKLQKSGDTPLSGETLLLVSGAGLSIGGLSVEV